MLKRTRTFLAGHADRTDDGFSRNETTGLSRAAIFGTIAFVDHRIALIGTCTLAWIRRARGRVERGATRDIAGEWSTTDLLSHARCSGRSGGCRDRLRRCAGAWQVPCAVDVASLNALCSARTCTRDLLPRHAVFGLATRHKRQCECQCERNVVHGAWLARMHGGYEVALKARGFRRLRRCLR